MSKNCVIREFRRGDKNDASLLAEMWNASDKGWPWGWTRGVSETADRVLERKQDMDRLAIFVGECEGKIVGYGDLSAQKGQSDLAFLSLLNVQPDYQGKSIGRMLIQEILKRTIELGFAQLGIGTWASNRQSVPLYKKTGFYWVPETSVFMLNFIPLILSFPATSDFFQKHDWYTCFRRKLEICPDIYKWHGYKVFPYEFAAGNQRCTFYVDHRAGGFTAVETDSFSVACIVGEEEVPVSIEHPVRWEITNHTPDLPLDVVLVVAGGEGINLNVLERFEVKKRKTLERQFLLDPEIKQKKRGELAHRIVSQLIVNGRPATLHSAVVPVQPVEIAYDGERIVQERDNHVRITLRNNLKYAVSGTLSIDERPGLVIDPPSQEFMIPAKSWSSCAIGVSTDKSGSESTKIRIMGAAAAKNSSLHFAGKAKEVYFRAAPFGGVTRSDMEKCILLETDSTALEVKRKGEFVLHDRISGKPMISCGIPELGPPYTDWRHIEPTYDCSISEGKWGISAQIVAPSDAHEGMVVESRIAFSGGPVYRLDTRIVNNREKTAKLKLQLESSPRSTKGIITLPIDKTMLHHSIEGWGVFPEIDSDLPTNPLDYAEQWCATERNGKVSGLIWKNCEKIEFDWGIVLRYDLPALKPHSWMDLDPVYLVAAGGDWRVVRHYWQKLYQDADVREDCAPGTQPVLTAGFSERPLLVIQGKTSAPIRVENRRRKELSGTLRVDLSSPQKIELEHINRDNPFDGSIALEHDCSFPKAEKVHFSVNNGPVIESFPQTVVVLGDKTVAPRVTGTTDVEVDNGNLSFKIDPSFRGSIHSIKWQGKEQVRSPYPETGIFSFVNPWHGGIHSLFGGADDRSSAIEVHEGKPITRKGDRGISWTGYTVWSDFTHKDRKWLRLETDYLTIGNSNVVAVVTRCVNKTDAPQQAPMGVACWLQSGGEISNSCLHYLENQPRYGNPDETRLRIITRQRSEYEVDLAGLQWAALENPENGHVAVVMNGWPGARIAVIDSGEKGAYPMVSYTLALEPLETRELVSWILFCESLDQALEYRALSKIWILP